MRELRRQLGAFALELVELCAIDDSSLALGRRLGVNPKTARERTIDALKALSAMGLLDGG